MTRYTPLWQQAGTYPAAVDRGLLSALWPATGFTGAAPTTVNNTMNVSVPAGTAAVALASGAGTELCRWDAAEVVTLTASPPAGQSRIDVVVLQVRDNTLDAGGNNDFIFQAIAGTPTTGTPAAPTVPNNAAAVCQLTVVGGSANLNGVAVTDRRPRLAGPATGARVWQSAAQTVPNTTVTTLSFDTVEHNAAGLWDPAGGRMVIPVTGLYLITARCEVQVAAGSTARVFLQAGSCGGPTLARGPDLPFTAADLQFGITLTTVRRMIPGDCVFMSVFQSTGAARATNPGQSTTFFECTLLGSN
jgi:hypothetical protein